MGMIGPPEVWCKHCGHLSSRYTTYCSSPACKAADYRERLEAIKKHFLEKFAEHPKGESPFDASVLDALDSVAKEFGAP